MTIARSSNFVIDVSDEITSDNVDFTFKNGYNYTILLKLWDVNGASVSDFTVDL